MCENPTWRSYTISKGFILGEVSSHEEVNCDSEAYPLLDVIYEIERRRELPPKAGAASTPDHVKANIASTEVDPKRFVDESIPPPHASAAPGEEDESEIENNDFKTTPEPQLPFSSLHRINKLDANILHRMRKDGANFDLSLPQPLPEVDMEMVEDVDIEFEKTKSKTCPYWPSEEKFINSFNLKHLQGAELERVKTLLLSFKHTFYNSDFPEQFKKGVQHI